MNQNKTTSGTKLGGLILSILAFLPLYSSYFLWHALW